MRPDSIDAVNESDCTFMLSTLNIAIFNIECPLGYFVPYGDGWDQAFKGCLRCNQTTIDFVCKNQRTIPPSMEYLSGIFKVFEKHIQLYYDISDPMLEMSKSINNPLFRMYALVTFTYIYDPSINILSLLDRNWRDFTNDYFVSYGVRWGPSYSPLASLSLQTTWTYFPQGAFVHNVAHSDLDPMLAPKWTLNATWNKLNNEELTSSRNTPLSRALYNLLRITKDLLEDSGIDLKTDNFDDGNGINSIGGSVTPSTITEDGEVVIDSSTIGNVSSGIGGSGSSGSGSSSSGNNNSSMINEKVLLWADIVGSNAMKKQELQSKEEYDASPDRYNDYNSNGKRGKKLFGSSKKDKKRGNDGSSSNGYDTEEKQFNSASDSTHPLFADFIKVHEVEDHEFNDLVRDHSHSKKSRSHKKRRVEYSLLLIFCDACCFFV